MEIPAFCFIGNVFYYTFDYQLLTGHWSSSLSTQPQSEPLLT